MRVLIFGGTRFVGRHIAEAFLAARHTVTLLTRGESPDPLPAAVERLRGDRDAPDAGLAALASRTFDACIDVTAYTPRQLRPAAELLRDRVARYVFISAVSVYGDPKIRPVLETHPLVPAAPEHVADVTAATYGPLKVACESILRQTYGDRAAILRPQVVAGPHDPSGRYAYWVRRAALPGPMLAPGDGRDHVQVIDARDLARFTVTAVERELSGAFNLAGPRLTWAGFLRILGAAQLVWAPADILRAANLTFLEVPLYRPENGIRAALMDIGCARAQAAGLVLTDPAVTARDTLAWCRDCSATLALSPERESELLAKLRANP